MSPQLLALSLCLVSAVTVAAVGFLVKRGGDVLVARSVMSFGMALTALPFAPFVPLPPVYLLPAFALAIAVHWAYQYATVSALHRGDLSLVFPVMRGLAPLFAGLFGIVALGETFTPVGWAGLLLASMAVIVFALPTGATRQQRRVDRLALIYAVLTAIGIGAYTVTDAGVIRQMPSPYTFIVWLFLIDWMGVTLIALMRRRGRIVTSYRPVLRDGIVGGLFGAVSYAAALYAFTLADAALVTALRETSVVFAALMGAIWLKEGFGIRRAAAALVLATGLLLMQLYG